MTAKRLILLAMVMMLIAACASKSKLSRRSEWHGLTENEVRSKLDARLPGKIPDDKRSAISDKVVAKMRDRGAIADDSTDSDESAGTPDDLPASGVDAG